MFNPQFILINRYELIRKSRQALPVVPGPFTPGVSVPSADFGNIDSLVFGYRYYPFISSRAGFAFHNEYALVRQRGAAPLTGTDLKSSSRSEERRVGKECRCRWSPHHNKKNTSAG